MVLFRIDLKFVINLKSIRWQGQSFGRSSWFNTAAWVLKNLPKVIYIAFLLSNGHTGLDCMICFHIIREPVVQMLKISHKCCPSLAGKKSTSNEFQIAHPILEYWFIKFLSHFPAHYKIRPNNLVKAIVQCSSQCDHVINFKNNHHTIKNLPKSKDNYYLLTRLQTSGFRRFPVKWNTLHDKGGKVFANFNILRNL